MHQLDIFIDFTNGNGAKFHELHLRGDAGKYTNNDNGYWKATWMEGGITTCAADVAKRVQRIPNWNIDLDPFEAVTMKMRITLTNTETTRCKKVYENELDTTPYGCNMSEEENSFYFNFLEGHMPGGPDTDELAPYFAVDFNDPADSEVGLCVMMPKDVWQSYVTRFVGK